MPHRDGVRGQAPPATAAARRPAPPLPAWATALLCAGGVLFIGLLDLAQAARHWSVPVVAVLDEPAHLATAALLLAALLPGRARALVPWALAGAVLIDLDHIPLYLWDLLTSDGSGRPVTHSLLTVLVLVCAGLLARTRTRTALLGLALGVALHLVRDLGTGPGVPLLWPLDGRSVLVPYAAYFAAVAAAAVIAAGRVPLARARARRKAAAAAIAAPYTP